jgi:hypothetical protein
MSRRSVGGEIRLPSLFRPRSFRSEAAAYVDNRQEAIIRHGPRVLSGQSMCTQHWGPVLTIPGRSATHGTGVSKTKVAVCFGTGVLDQKVAKM